MMGQSESGPKKAGKARGALANVHTPCARFCCCDKDPNKISFGKKEFIWLTIPDHSSLFWGSQGRNSSS